MSKSSHEKLESIPGLGTVQDGEGAVREVEKEALALPDNRVVVPNFDVTAAVMMVGLAKPGITALREVIRKRAPDVDIKNLDRIGVYALAAWHVSTAGRIETNKPDSAAMYDTAEKLLGDLEAGEAFLVRRNALRAEDVDQLKPKPGERQTKAWLLDSLEKHIHLWRKNWSAIEGFNLVPKSEIDEGAHLLAQIMMPAESPSAHVSAENDFRYRVVALFAAAWEEIRRGVRHVRWYQDDFDAIAPSLRLQSGHRVAQTGSTGADATPPSASVAQSPEIAKDAPKVVAPPSDGKVIPGDDGPFKKS